MNNVGIIVLAAGSSSRLGSPKQLLTFKGQPLILHIVNEGHKAALAPVVIVTGSHTDEVAAVLNNEKTVVVFNEHWQDGMGSGIVAGVTAMLSVDGNIQKVIISVCDQPYLSATLFQQMIDMQNETGKDIVSCTYSGTVGTPVLFTRKYFNQLLQLKGEEGAKKILKSYPGDMATVDFPEGAVDIDTMDDYARLVG